MQTCTHALGNKYKCLVSKLIRASMAGLGGGGGFQKNRMWWGVGGGRGGEVNGRDRYIPRIFLQRTNAALICSRPL